jgi:hypothetical protein
MMDADSYRAAFRLLHPLLGARRASPFDCNARPSSLDLAEGLIPRGVKGASVG